jgi:hypothetical protein
MEGSTGTLRIFWMQISQSKSLFLVVFILALGVLTSLVPEYSLVSKYLLYSAKYFLILVVSMALITAEHEMQHISELNALGYEIDNLQIHRIGSVSFRIRDSTKMTPEERFRVASAPFTAPSQYAGEPIVVILLATINIFVLFPLNIVLIIFTVLAIVSLLANFCCYFIIIKGWTTGLCVGLARAVTSKGDIDEIVNWNKLKKYTRKVGE